MITCHSATDSVLLTVSISDKWTADWSGGLSLAVAAAANSLKLYSLHVTVPVPHIPCTSAYRRRICLAEPVSVLQNMEIWTYREQPRNSAKEVSALLLQSSGTVFRNSCARPPSPKDISSVPHINRSWFPFVHYCSAVDLEFSPFLRLFIPYRGFIPKASQTPLFQSAFDNPHSGYPSASDSFTLARLQRFITLFLLTYVGQRLDSYKSSSSVAASRAMS